MHSAFHSSGIGKSSTSLLAEVKAGRIHLCRMAGNTVWSHMAGDTYAPYSEMGFPIGQVIRQITSYA